MSANPKLFTNDIESTGTKNFEFLSNQEFFSRSDLHVVQLFKFFTRVPIVPILLLIRRSDIDILKAQQL